VKLSADLGRHAVCPGMRQRSTPPAGPICCSRRATLRALQREEPSSQRSRSWTGSAGQEMAPIEQSFHESTRENPLISGLGSFSSPIAQSVAMPAPTRQASTLVMTASCAKFVAIRDRRQRTVWPLS
jgi:hypothetical protein